MITIASAECIHFAAGVKRTTAGRQAWRWVAATVVETFPCGHRISEMKAVCAGTARSGESG
jgi:hypothetical protein